MAAIPGPAKLAVNQLAANSMLAMPCKKGIPEYIFMVISMM
jgi:hypothetical protein